MILRVEQRFMHNHAPVDQIKSSALLAATLARHLHAKLIETHISWLILTKDIVYKIKKPVQLAFVDYSTLEARRHFCEEELRLNGRLAPALYLGVTPIAGSPEQSVLDETSPVLEYAVRMRRFPPGALFSEQLAAGTLQPGDVDSLAALLAGFHASAPAAPVSSRYGSAARRRAVALDALNGIGSLATDIQKVLLSDWIQGEARALAPLWEQRRAKGRIRECHGDLHLANVVSLDTGVAAFDGIEFNAALRWIDVLDDIAFVVMIFSRVTAWTTHFGF
jgi:aminoglycoside phosphotransferase family enzyme